MPLYDYRCHKCGETFEVRQKFSDELLTVHEGCGGEVERLVSAPALQFKGSGWYVTDYGRNGKTPSASPDSSAGTKSDAKPEAKPAAKTETKSDSK
jgi:putative FmdB family regulatory protein